jgi:hypothetical protein
MKKEFSLYKKSTGIYYVRAWDPERGEYTRAKSTGKTDSFKSQKQEVIENFHIW